ncbi:tRNA (guanine-N(7)-)-methyltransferase non-catalytic subunit trm82 [Coemansia interrupta]|uniref:tRNA (Guanine-N(7)-)-methyltransferase non-catalytic subunit trm82 n=1 Tax=Coemansia interrupta TaxID=1126814 RepID=A0A9W8LIX2_9FUNG|nr:tRNA (guanine-N(7)-)-methyltransferase non-catalytic subunit trm82 [Coemansia interrupta]
MPHHPVTLVESSAQGAVACISETAVTVLDGQTGSLLATTHPSSTPTVHHIPSVPTTSGNIRAAAFSPTGRFFALCTEGKSLLIYDTSAWTLLRHLTSDKRTNALAFDPLETHVLAGDKFGDCTSIPLDAAHSPSVILGHVSILCALAFTHTTPPMLLTCDRDEKLRISRYPNAYNIQAFGLGHSEFVTSVAAPRFAPQVCMTGSGDGSLRLWDVRDGGLLHTVELSSLLQSYYADGRAEKADGNSFEDRTQASERYGVLRVCAAEGLGAFVVVVERFPVVIVLPVEKDGRSLADPLVVDVQAPPTDMAPTAQGFIVAYAKGPLLADAYVRNKQGAYVRDTLVSEEIARTVVTREVPEEVQVPSIYVWGNKMYIERPAGENSNSNNKNEEDD